MPRVVDPSLKVVFCEGRPGSLDDLLLGHILPLGRTLVEPVGGKRGMRSFMEGYLGGYSGRYPEHLGFRDRDFDIEPSEDPQLIRLPGGQPIWLTHRAAIENYLIDASLVRQYWVEHENTPNWAYGPALSTQEIQEHIHQSAYELVDYQAVRWALAGLKPGPRWPEIRTTWTDHGSGDIPLSLDFDSCLADASRLVDMFRGAVDAVSRDLLCELAKRYHVRFEDNSFLKGRKYLVWFHGKDHLVQLCRRLADGFPRRHYATWASQRVDVKKYSDLMELVNRVR